LSREASSAAVPSIAWEQLDLAAPLGRIAGRSYCRLTDVFSV